MNYGHGVVFVARQQPVRHVAAVKAARGIVAPAGTKKLPYNRPEPIRPLIGHKDGENPAEAK